MVKLKRKIMTALTLLTGGSKRVRILTVAVAQLKNKKSVNIAVGARYSPSFSNTLIDYEPHCATWAAIGECNSNHDYMFDNCAYSCVSAEDLGEVGYFYEHLSNGEDFEQNEQ